MTEVEWQCNPSAIDEMLNYCAVTGSERKLRQVLYACCCRVEHALTDARSRAALDGLSQYIEGPPHREKLLSLRALALEAYNAVIGTPDVDTEFYPTAAEEAAHAVVCLTNPDPATTPAVDISPLTSAAYRARRVFGGSVYNRTSNSDDETQARMATEAAIQANLLRDIFGNPFRPVALDPNWLTTDVRALARGVYDDRAFDRMPILADALQDAGCANEDILAHCRDPNQVHVRGCWVIDLLLGKG